MTAELLREAATLLRERAEAAREVGGKGSWRVHETGYTVMDGAGLDIGTVATEAESTYIATMYPGVALAVADWLDAEATTLDAMAAFTAATIEQKRRWQVRGAGIDVRRHSDGELSIAVDTSQAALAVARAILGRPA